MGEEHTINVVLVVLADIDSDQLVPLNNQKQLLLARLI